MDEFKAWFEGYSEHITDAPTKDQWERIKERVAMIGMCDVMHGDVAYAQQLSNYPAQGLQAGLCGGLQNNRISKEWSGLK